MASHAAQPSRARGAIEGRGGVEVGAPGRASWRRLGASGLSVSLTALRLEGMKLLKPKAPRRRILRPQTLATRKEGELWWAYTVVEGGGTRVEALLGSGATEAEALAKVRKDWRSCCSISVRSAP